MTIMDGWRLAVKAARDALYESSFDRSYDKETFREALLNIARTTLSSKLLNKDKEKFSALAVDAVLRLEGSTDLNLIQVIKLAGGSLEESYLEVRFPFSAVISYLLNHCTGRISTRKANWCGPTEANRER